MLDIRVKTLDGRDHRFNVDDGMTIKDFKAHIAEGTGIIPERQRLIFKGHVLLDEKKLTEVGADGNVLHLVERPENSRGIQGNGQPRRSTTQRRQPLSIPIHNFTLQEIEESVRRTVIRLGVEERNLEITASHAGFGAIDARIVVRNPTPEDTDSPARSRIQHIRTVIRHLNHILHHLEHDDVDDSTVRDVDADITVVPPECQETSHEENQGSTVQGDDSASSLPSLVEDSGSDNNESDSANAQRTRHAHVWDLTDVLAEILRVQERMRPQLEIYQRMLRNEEDYSSNIREGRRVSRFFNGIQVALHNLSHVMHVFSDLNIHFCEPPPRRLYPQLGPVPQDQAASTEVQINLRFQSGSAMGGGAAGGGAGRGTAGTAAGNAAQGSTPGGNIQPTPTRRVIPVSSQGPQGDMQGLVSMEMSPNGSMVINGVAITTQPNETGSGTQTNPTTTQTTANLGSNTTSASAGAAGGSGLGGAGTNSTQGNQPQSQPAHLFQQIMQGIVGATTGSLGMGGGRGAAGGGNPPVRPGGQGPIPPTFAFPGAAAAAGAGGARGIRASFRVGAGNLPPGMQNFPQGMPFPMFQQPQQQSGAPGPVRGNLRGRFGNVNRGRGRSAGHGHGQSHAHPQPHHHHHHHPHNHGHHVGGTVNGSPGIFVGPAPPSELPLYTIDPHLPCPSRHFDPRLIRERQQRRAPASSATSASTAPETTTTTTASSGQTPTTASSSSATANTSTTPSQGESGARAEFEAALEQQMRPVIRNMFMRPNLAPRSTAADRQPQQMYSFQPVSVGNQTFGMSATPIMVDSDHQDDAMDVDHREDEGRERNNSASTESEEFEDAEEGDWDQMQGMITGMLNNMAGQGSNTTLGDFVRSMGMEDMAMAGEGLGRELYRILASTVTFRDIIDIFAGDTSPLNNQRTRIRRFVIDNVLNGNDRPSEEDLHSAAVRICESQSNDQDLLAGVQPRQPDLDIMGSLNNCELVAVEDILRLIFGYAEGNDFGQDLYDRLKRFLRELMVLGSRCCANGQTDFESILRRYLGSSATSQAPPALQMWMGVQGVEHLRSVMASGDISEADVERYVVFKTDERTSSSDSVSQECHTMETDSMSGLTEQNTSSVSLESEVSAAEPAQDELISWRQSLPQEWVSVIEEDIEKQARTPIVRRPFSDAYLSGVDPKRRRLVLDERHGLNGDPKLDLRSTLFEAVGSTKAQPVTGEVAKDVLKGADIDEPLARAYQTELDEQIRRRLQNDPDFTAEKFPAAFKHFKP